MNNEVFRKPFPVSGLPLALVFTFAAYAAAQDDPVTYKSDVALARVDVQVLDGAGRAVTGLHANDFVLRVGGRIVPIRDFASENMPIDIVLLLDVSGSMQPHVERIASAAQEALNVLADKDRIAIMVFDTNTRVRLPFSSSHSDITAGLRRVLRSERFNGGTRITSAMLSAASYIQREGRPEARRAIVILTDDETQDAEDEARVESALRRANAVLSFLQAPYEPPTLNGGGRPHGTWGSGGGSGGGWPGGGTGWPGGGGGIGFPGNGPVVLGRGGPGGYGVDSSHTAGTSTIASDSGGDTMNVDEASALEDTLARLRQRYTLNFYFPPSAAEGSSVRVDLSQQAAIEYTDAEVQSRQVFVANNGAGQRAAPTVVTHAQSAGSAADSGPSESPAATVDVAPRLRRAVNEDEGVRVNTIDDDSGSTSQPSETPASQPASAPSPPAKAPPAAQTPPAGGWPRANGPQTSKP